MEMNLKVKRQALQYSCILSLWLLATAVLGNEPSVGQQGEIQELYFEEIHETRTRLVEILGQVPAGDDAQSSPWFDRLETIREKLDQVTSSKAQTDLFALVPNLAQVFQEKEPLPFVSEAFGPLANLSVPLISSTAAYAGQQEGTAAPAVLANFVTMFAVGNGFVSEANWEDRPMPIDAAGVMILDAATVASQVKNQPWQQGGQFLGGAKTAGEFFANYTGNGGGLAVLKAKYLANRAGIDAQFTELKAWVDGEETKAGSRGGH